MTHASHSQQYQPDYVESPETNKTQPSKGDGDGWVRDKHPTEFVLASKIAVTISLFHRKNCLLIDPN